MVLKKEITLYDRDQDGNLIPQKVELKLASRDKEKYPELVGEEIFITPMPRGEIKKRFNITGKVDDTEPQTDRDEDAEIIVEHCKNPQYTLEELKFAKPIVVRSIVRTIFAESGIGLDDDSGTKKLEENDEFSKNSDASVVKNKKED